MPRQVRFAHPAEAEIARLLDVHGVRWQYEPTTFALVTGEDGRSIQSFTPDFYLPDHDLYIEMTTMRQSLVTRKNRKFRQLRELYPDLNVRLLYRKDVELILDRYFGPREEGSFAIMAQQVIRSDQIQHRTAEMADAVRAEASDDYWLLALGGGAIRTRDRVADLLSPAEHLVGTGLLSVGPGSAEHRTCSLNLELDAGYELSKVEVVVVADIVGTGLTALTAITWLRAHGAKRIRLISLLDRRSSRLVDVPVEFAGFPVAAHWLVGAGLGHGSQYRELPDIHSLSGHPAP